LLSERGAGLDWQKTDLIELHDACHTARAESDLSGLTAMFAKILDDGPAYEF
jgi:cell filamentation protein